MTQEDALELLENTTWSLGESSLWSNNWHVYLDFFTEDMIIFEYNFRHVATFPIVKEEKTFLWFTRTVRDANNPILIAFNSIIDRLEAKDQLVFNEEVKESLKLIKNGKAKRISS